MCDTGGTRTPNQQDRNLSFYPLNYGAFLEKTDFCIAKIQRSDNLYYLIDNKEAQMKLLVHVKWLIL